MVVASRTRTGYATINGGFVMMSGGVGVAQPVNLVAG